MTLFRALVNNAGATRRIETIEYKTLTAFIEDCKKNGLRLVKFKIEPCLGPRGKILASWVEIRVTAFSTESPVLRCWKTDEGKDPAQRSILGRLEMENFYVSEGEWTPNLLRELLKGD